MVFEVLNLENSIYVAGHNGLIGSAVVRRLQELGFSNIILAARHEVDLVDRDAVDAFFKERKPVFVLLCAGKVGGIGENLNIPADFININLAIQMNVFRAAHANCVRKLIFFGSSCMYPRNCPQPMPESALLTGMPEPSSLPYALSKLVGVQMCLAYNKQYGAQRFIPVIPNSVYGPNDDYDTKSGHVLSALIRRFHEATLRGDDEVVLWGSGNPRREFIHSDDIANACVCLLTQSVSQLELPINIGTGADISIRELAEAIARVTGFRGKISQDLSKPDGAPQKLLDSARIRGLGWHPEIVLEAGLEQTYTWYLENIVPKEKSFER